MPLLDTLPDIMPHTSCALKKGRSWLPIFVGIVWMICAFPVHAATSGLAGNICRPGGINSDGTFHIQGQDTPCPTRRVDADKSTWACPGRTLDKDMLRIDCSYGQKAGPKECVFIDNFYQADGKKNAFFVPLNTPDEWLSFRNANNLPAGLEIHVGCGSGIFTDTSQNEFALPNMRVPEGEQDPGTFETASANDPQCTAIFQCLPPTVKVGSKFVPVKTGCGTWSIVSQSENCAQQAALTFSGKVCNKEAKGAEFVIALDASYSMDQLLSAAQTALRDLTATYLVPRPDIPVTITVFGGAGYPNSIDDPSKALCTYGRLYGPLVANTQTIDTALAPVRADNNTPIDTGMRFGADFFQDRSKRRVMLLLSDGVETCFGNPAFGVQELRQKQGIEIYGIKYGINTAPDTLAFFNAMNRYSPANSQEEIKAAIENVVKDVVETSCKPILRLYETGKTDGDVLYTILEGQTIKVKRGTYDAVVDYCTGTQLFPNQKFEADRNFEFNKVCAR